MFFWLNRLEIAAMAQNVKQIIVIGAGIGGLAAGLALQRRGFRVVVYERASEIREIGAGVVIAPNARRALRDLGVDAALEAMSCSVSVLHTCDYATGKVTKTNHNEQIIEQQGMGVLQVGLGDAGQLSPRMRSGLRGLPEAARGSPGRRR